MSFIDWISGKKSKMKKEEDLKIVTDLHLRLKELGEDVTIEKLLWISNNGIRINKEKISYKVVFSWEEYCSFCQKVLPEGVRRYPENQNYIYYLFPVEELELVVRAKQLTTEIDKCVEAIKILQRKEKGSGLSEDAQIKLKGLKNQKTYMKKELERIVEIKTYETIIGYNTRIEFNTSILKSEEEVLGMVKEVMKPKEEKGTVSGKESLPVKEMKEFLETNRLPEDVTKELNETIDLIDSYLKSNKEEDDVEKLRMKAKVLVKSAKDYHHIAQ